MDQVLCTCLHFWNIQWVKIRLGSPCSPFGRRLMVSQFVKTVSLRLALLQRRKIPLSGPLRALFPLDWDWPHWYIIRHIPLNLLTEDADGKVQIDRSLVLKDREITIPLDPSKPYKLNAGTTGVCKSVYKSPIQQGRIDIQNRPCVVWTSASIQNCEWSRPQWKNILVRRSHWASAWYFRVDYGRFRPSQRRFEPSTALFTWEGMWVAL